MKDKYIAEKLNSYADALPRHESLLYDAYREIDSMYLRPAPRKAERSKFRYFISAAAIIIAIIVTIFAVTNNNSGTNEPEPPSYSLNVLNRTATTADAFQTVAGSFYIAPSDSAMGIFYEYTADGLDEPMLYIAKYKVVRKGCVDMVTVIADLKNGLTDYSKYDPTADGFNSFSETYKNGEYYTVFSILQDGTTFYVMTTSPNSGAINYYQNIFS